MSEETEGTVWIRLLLGRERGDDGGRGERLETGDKVGRGDGSEIGLGGEGGEGVGIEIGVGEGVRTEEAVDGLLGRRTSLAKRLLKRREWACGLSLWRELGVVELLLLLGGLRISLRFCL